MGRKLVAVLLGALPLASCMPTPRPPAPSATASDLAASLEVEVLASDSARMTLHVTNGSGAPVALDFPTAQRYDFSVVDSSGATVWRWSAGRTFAQVVGRRVLEPGDTETYTAVWRGVRPGTYTAVGRLMAVNAAISERATFEVVGS